LFAGSIFAHAIYEKELVRLGFMDKFEKFSKNCRFILLGLVLLLYSQQNKTGLLYENNHWESYDRILNIIPLYDLFD